MELLSASDELRVDREMALEAVKQNGKALHHVAEKVRNDRDVVL